MKIGIITVHDSTNFGSILQAFGLKTILEEMNHDVYFIKTRTKKDIKRIFMSRSKSIRKYLHNRDKYKIFLKDINLFNEIELDEVKKNPNCLDTIIIGSDELWNVRTPVFRNGYFYGIDINVKKKITYAISSGDATYDELVKYPELIEGIKSIDKIFIRDELTKNNVEAITGVEPEFTCDPTFLIDIELFKKKFKNNIKGKYILIYSYSYSEKQKEYIIKYARKNNLLIVSVGLYCSWVDKNINCSPFEFSDVICNADAVVTTTFHGTIFSILNKKPFISFTGRQKTKDVLEKTGLLNALIDENIGYDEFEKQFNVRLDFEGAHNRINKMREESIEKLKCELII